MPETILNIYLIINNGNVEAFKAKGYEQDGTDDAKIAFLKERAINDYNNAYHFDAPVNKRGAFMPYNQFAKLEKQGMHYQLFETIFNKFEVPENPLICVTPVVDGEVWGK